MTTSEAATASGDADVAPARGTRLRVALLVLVALLVVGLLVFAAISGLGADPMTGT